MGRGFEEGRENPPPLTPLSSSHHALGDLPLLQRGSLSQFANSPRYCHMPTPIELRDAAREVPFLNDDEEQLDILFDIAIESFRNMCERSRVDECGYPANITHMEHLDELYDAVEDDSKKEFNPPSLQGSLEARRDRQRQRWAIVLPSQEPSLPATPIGSHAPKPPPCQRELFLSTPSPIQAAAETGAGAGSRAAAEAAARAAARAEAGAGAGAAAAEARAAAAAEGIGYHH